MLIQRKNKEIERDRQDVNDETLARSQLVGQCELIFSVLSKY